MATLTKHQASLPVPRKKLVIVGDGCSGKTSLLMVQAGHPFPENYSPTIFENYITRVPAPYNPKTLLELSLWDTAGQEDYDRLRPLSYPETDVVVICFSLVDWDAFENVREKWHPEINHFLRSTPILLVATKSDLRDVTPSHVTTQQGMTLAKDIGAVKYLETSAKMKLGVLDVFTTAAKLACAKRKKARGCPLL